jgi:NAD(P)H dehydrogenase (quinone)
LLFSIYSLQSFMDSTGGLWAKGALIGKTGGTITSVGTIGGGQETVALSCLPFMAHQGIVFVPLGYSEPKVFTFDEVHGASPYGCGTFAGADGSRQPTDLEKEIAASHGKHFATITAKLAA